MYTPLLIIGILSVIGATCGILYGFGLYGVSEMSSADIQDALAAAGLGGDSLLIEQMRLLADLGPWFVVFNIIEIAGAVIAMRRLWAGFHLYTVSQIGLAGLMVIAVGFSGALISIMWNAAWVLIYYNLMRRATINDNSSGGPMQRGTEI